MVFDISKVTGIGDYTGTVTKTFNESGSGNSTWTVSLTCPNVTATGSSFNTPVISSCTAKFAKGTSNRNYAEAHIGDALQLQMHGEWGYATLTTGEFYRNPGSATSGTTYTLTRSGFSSKSISTSDVFVSENKTVRTLLTYLQRLLLAHLVGQREVDIMRVKRACTCL